MAWHPMKPETIKRRARQRMREQKRQRAALERACLERYDRDKKLISEEYARAVWLDGLGLVPPEECGG